VAEIAAPLPVLLQAWADVEEVQHIDVTALDGDYCRCSLSARDGVDLRPVIFRMAAERGWGLRELTRGKHSLEDIFIKLTRGEKEEEHT
jgi:hypothetical protein